MTLSRRNFLKSGAAASLGAASGFAFDLARFNAFAADTSGYKAMVCVFLFGGMDGHDTVIPFDDASYGQYAQIRRDLLNRYDDNNGGSTRDRDRLLPLNLANASNFPGRQFAMPEELGPIHELVARGDGAIVGNVGPLVAPLDRTAYRERTGPRPPRLFSHNDQQSVWMSSQPEGAQFGWGGRVADMALAAAANPDATFTAVSVAGTNVFLSGETASQIEVGSSGPAEIIGIGDDDLYGSSSLPSIYEDLLRAQGGAPANLFQRDYTNVVSRSIDANRLLRESFENSTPFATAFPDTRIARQLRIVAQMIALRGQLGVNRQIFFVGMGGYDTHSRQATSIPRLHGELAGAVRAFYDSMAEIGADRDVTTFTASDFGRTLTVNRDGTDHGWGGHHFVIGGGVQGNQILGDIPPPVRDHSQDAGNGRLIPTTAVDQFAATLGRWFGLNDSELDMALPGLRNFSSRDIGLF